MKNLLLFLTLFITSYVSRGQTYNPTNFTISNKAYGIAQAAPTDARSYFYDASLFIQRPYQSTAEVLSYLNLAKYRVGQFPIYVSSGTLQSGGTFTGGSISEYWFKDGTANSNLVQKTAIVSGLNYSEYEQLINKISPGALAGQNGFSLSSGATAINSGISTTITAPFVSDYVLSPRRFSKGKIRFLLSNNPSKPMLCFGSLTNYFALWSGSDNIFEFGQVTNSTTVNSLVQSTVAITGAVWVDINFQGQAAGQAVQVKVWGISQSEPLNPTFSYSFTGSETAIVGDQVTLRTIGANATGFQALGVLDDAVTLRSKANFNGFWFPITRNGKIYLGTINQGSEMNFDVENATFANMNIYNDPRAAFSPVIAVSVDGAQFYNVPFSTTGDIVLTLASNLDPKQKHKIEVIVKGIHESDDVWNLQIGFLTNGINSDGSISKQADNRPLAWFFGDSITGGIVALGYAPSGPVSQPLFSDAVNSYGALLSRKLNFKAWVRGFGGSGITVGGNGGVPSADTSFYNFAQGYPMYNLPKPDFLFINEGTNDGGRGVSSSALGVAYVAQINKLKLRLPSTDIYLIQQLNQYYSNTLDVAAVAGVNYLPTSNFVSNVTFTDGTHPNVNGANVIATNLYLEFTGATTRQGFKSLSSNVYTTLNAGFGVAHNPSFPIDILGSGNTYLKVEANNKQLFLGVDTSRGAVFQSGEGQGFSFLPGGAVKFSLDAVGNTNLSNSVNTTALNNWHSIFNDGSSLFSSHFGYNGLTSRFRYQITTPTNGDFEYATHPVGAFPTSQASFVSRLVSKGTNGFLGINSADPQQQMDVNGANDTYIKVTKTGVTTAYFGADDNGAAVQTAAGKPVFIRPNGRVVAEFDTSGVTIGNQTDAGNLTVLGSVNFKIRAVNGDILLGRTDHFISCTGNTFTVTLPDAGGAIGRVYEIKNFGEGVVTVAATSGQTISGAATQTQASGSAAVRYVSDGVNWLIF